MSNYGTTPGFERVRSSLVRHFQRARLCQQSEKPSQHFDHYLNMLFAVRSMLTRAINADRTLVCGEARALSRVPARRLLRPLRLVA
jgi:hypothetical protein